MQDTILTQITSITANQSLPFIVCTDCQINIQFIRLYPSEGQMNIRTYCECNKQDRWRILNQYVQKLKDIEAPLTAKCLMHNANAQHYCIKCFQWLCQECSKFHQLFTNKHPLNKYELTVRCSQHKKPFKLFCRRCNVNSCEDCDESHKNHKTVTIANEKLRDKQMNMFDEVMKTNQQVTEAFIARIDQEFIKLQQYKSDIQSIYKTNEKINYDLKQQYYSIVRTSNSIKKYPCFALMKIQQTILIDTKQYYEQQSTIDEQ